MNGMLQNVGRRSILAAATLALLGAGPAAAQSYPAGKVINVIVPYAPGGTTDTLARVMAAALEPELKTKVQVVNRAGAASQVGRASCRERVCDSV